MTGQQDKDDTVNALANRIPRDQLDKLLAFREQLKTTAEPEPKPAHRRERPESRYRRPDTDQARPPEG